MIADFPAHFDGVHAITCKAVRQIPDKQRDFRPASEMMTAFDLVFHMFSQEKVKLGACTGGRLSLEDFRRVESDKHALQSIEDLARYGEEVHATASRWMRSASEAEVGKTVQTFIGPSTPEKLLLSALEHILHHRGQLYVYLRLMGIEPVFVWSGDPMSVVGKQFGRAA